MSYIDRDEAIKRIRAALKRRSGKDWSVTGDRGTACGWIHVQAPPKRRIEFGYTSPEECDELARLFGLRTVHCQGVSINPDAREWYVGRAENGEPTDPEVDEVRYNAEASRRFHGLSDATTEQQP